MWVEGTDFKATLRKKRQAGMKVAISEGSPAGSGTFCASRHPHCCFCFPGTGQGEAGLQGSLGRHGAVEVS